MDKMEQELNKKLAQWAGWHWEKYQLATGGAQSRVLLSPDEGIVPTQVGYIPDHTPAFTESLDACFKWLVPKVSKTNEIIIIIPPNTERRFLVEIGHQSRLEAESLALALCKAIEKLIDGGTNG